ncbi:hypothetical protein VRB69_04685 [Erwinia aphidicola]|uniref:hypothetical protein n=1 Tax=Erwinia aphidicola TaxID=68334 RepID=UPI0030CC22C6
MNNESTEYFSLTSEQPGVIASGHHLYASAGELTNAASSISSGGKMVLTGNHLEVLSYDGGIKKISRFTGVMLQLTESTSAEI